MDFKKVTVFAPQHPAGLHEIIVSIFSRKTGAPVYSSHIRSMEWLVVCSDGDVVGKDYNDPHRVEMSLRELYELPDYKEKEPTKEMTLPEIIKELGYEVKIVK